MTTVIGQIVCTRFFDSDSMSVISDLRARSVSMRVYVVRICTAVVRRRGHEIGSRR